MLVEESVVPMIISGAVGLLTSLVTIRYIMKNFIRLGISGIDHHKPSKPRIPEMGGLAFIAGVVAASIPMLLLNLYFFETLGILATVLATGIVGIVDDLKKLSAISKPILTAIAGLPLIVLHPYKGVLTLPFGVAFRIPLVYLVIIPALLSVVSNSINMFDTMNGTATGSSLLTLITIFLAIVLKYSRGDFDIALAGSLFIIVLFPLLVLLIYNRYPARVFIGDTGTLSIGGALLAFSIINNCETLLIISLLPHLTNGFFNLSSVGRLFERSELSVKPIIVHEDGTITANTDSRAPITLTRFITALGFNSEKEIVSAIMILCILCNLLTILTVILGFW
jgi:UDP-N-acetylglucosamine--dolichyl-phosphate N-acetylglucosaminephosphotransferase